MQTFVMYTAFDYNSNKVTGGTRRFIEIIEGLIQNGHTVHLFAPVSNNILQHPNLIKYEIKQRKSKIIPNGLLNLISNYTLLKSIRKISYDSFIVVSVPYAIQCVFLRLKRLKLIIWEDFVGYKKIQLDSKNLAGFIKKIILKVYTLIERKVLISVDKVIVQCKYDEDITLRRHPEFKSELNDKFEILFNNVNPSWIEAKEELIQEKTVIESNYRQLIFIGNIDDKRKGLHLLLEAFVKIEPKFRNVKLVVVGNGGLLENYREKYKEFNIEFMGYVSNPLPLLVKCDLMIVPSLADSFPNTVMEALYFEVPVIGSSNGGIPEMLVYSDLLFDTTVDSLYYKLVDIFETNKFSELKEKGLKRKKELTFDWVSELLRVL